uniref:Uncharacterized protein n=1 Tax=Elaeophora elaphi TaxID=1147741 RepID=A0A0R3RFU6_9BILA
MCKIESSEYISMLFNSNDNNNDNNNGNNGSNNYIDSNNKIRMSDLLAAIDGL